MTLQVARLGSYATPKIAFKGKDFSSGVCSSGKGQSSSSSERTERPRRTETAKPSEGNLEQAVKKATGKITEAATDTIKVTRAELLEKLAKYADDATMVRIITEQLKKLG